MAETAIVVLVPEAEPPSARSAAAHRRGRARMGAHVTLLYPFGDASLLDADRMPRVSEALGRSPRSTSRSPPRCAFPRNPRVLLPAPEPDEPFRAMTAALVAAFPEHPPYGGKYDDPIPHSTVAIGDDAVLDAIERELAGSLPIAARADGGDAVRARRRAGWRPLARLPFL